MGRFTVHVNKTSDTIHVLALLSVFYGPLCYFWIGRLLHAWRSEARYYTYWKDPSTGPLISSLIVFALGAFLLSLSFFFRVVLLVLPINIKVTFDNYKRFIHNPHHHLRAFYQNFSTYGGRLTFCQEAWRHPLYIRPPRITQIRYGEMFSTGPFSSSCFQKSRSLYCL